jgi:competence protein ComEC
VLGVVAATVSPFWLSGATFLAWLGGWPARWLILVAHTGAGLPDSVVGWPGGTTGALLLAGVLAVGLMLTRRRTVRIVVGVVAVAAVLGVLPVQVLGGSWPPAHGLVVACDVGQGDAIVLPLAAGQAVVVDSGPDPQPVDRCLRDLGVDTVPLLVVSHFHADHVGGVIGVFDGRKVGAVALPEYPEPAAGRQAVLAAAARAGTPTRVVSAGWVWIDGPLRLTVIGPISLITDSTSDPNNNSLVVLAELDGHRVMLPGDAQTEEQDAILAADGPDALRADTLKLAHHGSAYQSLGFLLAVEPSVVLVSVGVGNRYGHPNLAVLERLRRDGARVLRTDQSGDVAAIVDGSRLAVLEHGRSPGQHPP